MFSCMLYFCKDNIFNIGKTFGTDSNYRRKEKSAAILMRKNSLYFLYWNALFFPLRSIKLVSLYRAVQVTSYIFVSPVVSETRGNLLNKVFFAGVEFLLPIYFVEAPAHRTRFGNEGDFDGFQKSTNLLLGKFY